MIGVGAGELLLILVVAFIFVGPEDLPKVARALGKAVRLVRKSINEFTELTNDIDMDEKQ